MDQKILEEILKKLDVVVESNTTLEQRLMLLENEKKVKQESGTDQGGSSGVTTH